MRLYDRLGYRRWEHPPVQCFALDDGTKPREAETCHVMWMPLHESR